MLATQTRQEERASSDDLKLVIEQASLWLFKRQYPGELVDICHSGLGFKSKHLKLAIGKKINLKLYFKAQEFEVETLIVRRIYEHQYNVYGALFVETPKTLEYLIERLLEQEQTQQNVAKKEPPAKALNQRKMGKRVSLKDTQIFVKPMTDSQVLPSLNNPKQMIEANVVNISRGGIAFECQQKLSPKAPFQVQFRLSNLDLAMQATGVVHYMEKRDEHFYYGVEFKMVPMEFIRTLDSLL